MKAGDSAAAGLIGIPWRSLAEFYRLAARVRSELPAVVAPCLIMHALDDDIASIRNAELTAARVGGPVRCVWLKDSYHMITVDRERHKVIESTVEFLTQANSRVSLATEPRIEAVVAVP
jgi:carboxylesterase